MSAEGNKNGLRTPCVYRDAALRQGSLTGSTNGIAFVDKEVAI